MHPYHLNLAPQGSRPLCTLTTDNLAPQGSRPLCTLTSRAGLEEGIPFMEFPTIVDPRPADPSDRSGAVLGAARECLAPVEAREQLE